LSPKINLRARIERHSRVLQHNLYATSKKTWKTWLAVVSMVTIFMLPIYPTFATFVNSGNPSEFYRGDIDESSIINSYFGDNETVWDGAVFIQSKDSYLYVNAGLDEDNRDVSSSKDIIDYEVKWGESVGSIAEKFNVTRNSIFWANDFEASHIIHPGDVIKVPPVSGLIHEVKSWETLNGLANKYDVDSEDIMRQNLLLSASDLKIGDTIIIPGAIKVIPKPVVVPSTKAVAKSSAGSAATPTAAYSAPAPKSEYVAPSGSYTLTWRAPKHTFYWGNCTWYVAQYKNVNWGGNANQWLSNARAKGHATGSTAQVGAIIQFGWRGYNPYYGHVGIVTDIQWGNLIISDMNYRALWEVTTRKVAINDRSIQGYIYVD